MNILLFVLVAAMCIEFSMMHSDTPDMHFEFHYEHLSQKRHPFFLDGEPWKNGRKYVRAQFQKFGIRNITEQNFTTTVADQQVQGVNIIGLMEGSNKTGPIMIVGADYDTSLVANQHKDNTGGVASLLEVIHIFCDRVYWNPHHLNFTVIFVAFDLNTKEYRGSGKGNPGSHFFITDWLLPYMKKTGRMNNGTSKLRGAIILDSITTYNMEPKSQTLQEGFEMAMPSAYKEIEETDFRGDFLGLLYPKVEKNNSIIGTFTKNFNNNMHISLPFRLQEMELEISLGLVATDLFETINHQSHYYFWTNNANPLPAMLLFDTDSDRKDPNSDCMFNCSVTEFLTEDRIQFMERTTDAVWKTLIDLQTTFIDPSSSNTQSPPSLILLISLISCYILFQ